MSTLQNNLAALGLFVAGIGLACDSVSADHAPAKPAVQPETPAKTEIKPTAEPKSGDTPAVRDNAVDDKTKTGTENPGKKSNKKSTKKAVAPLQPKGVGAHGDSCKRSSDCDDGMACSGLYRNQPGKCIAKAKAKLACKGEGDTWGKWGRAQASYCMKTMSDGGKKCGDSKDCKGKCVQEQGRSGGVCQKYETEFGCYAELKNGKTGTIRCMD